MSPTLIAKLDPLPHVVPGDHDLIHLDHPVRTGPAPPSAGDADRSSGGQP